MTKWGNMWVQKYTPRGKTSEKLEAMQYFFFAFAVVFGVVLFLDASKIILTGSLLTSMRAAQDLVVDLLFGALIGVGPTRYWGRESGADMDVLSLAE